MGRGLGLTGSCIYNPGEIFILEGHYDDKFLFLYTALELCLVNL